MQLGRWVLLSISLLVCAGAQVSPMGSDCDAVHYSEAVLVPMLQEDRSAALYHTWAERFRVADKELSALAFSWEEPISTEIDGGVKRPGRTVKTNSATSSAVEIPRTEHVEEF